VQFRKYQKLAENTGYSRELSDLHDATVPNSEPNTEQSQGEKVKEYITKWNTGDKTTDSFHFNQ
jgi:uncharacterized protein YihD (DUF1040 family)